MLAIPILFSNESNVVQNLKVEDVPFDDGSGLVLTFDSLPSESRIIEYRIYRGVVRDTLFLIGTIEVDPNTSVAGTTMTFYDKDYRALVDINSPSKLKIEHGQPQGSPIYRAIPRDLRILGPLLDDFSVLGVIDKSIFFNKSSKVLQPANHSNSKEEELFASLRVVDFEVILANVLPGKEYYYTVLAVDERMRFYPYAPIVTGIASPNMCEQASKFYPVWLDDIATLNFEFELPVNSANVFQHSVYMLHSSRINEYEQFRNYMHDLDQWTKQSFSGDSLAIQPDEVVNPGILLGTSSFNFLSFRFVNGYLYQIDYPLDIIDFTQSRQQEINDQSGILFDLNLLNDYLFFVSMDDYSGFQAVSDLAVVSNANSRDLPELPSFTVRDKPNSKGDVNEISIGLPYAAVTQVNFRGRGNDQRKLLVSYDYSPHISYKVKSITFEFRDLAGTRFASHTEYYFSNVFKLDLPSLEYLEEGFAVFISFNAPSTSIHQESIYHQQLLYDSDLMSFRPSKPYCNNEDMSRNRYQIFKKQLAGGNFTSDTKISQTINLYDDYISEKYIYRLLNDYDLASNTLLFDGMIDLYYDETLALPLSTHLYIEDYLNLVEAKLLSLRNTLSERDESPEIETQIQTYEQQLLMQKSSSPLKEINQISSHHKRLIMLNRLRDTKKTSFSYFFVKTNSEGLFNVSNIYIDNKGNQYIQPTSNWFNFTTIPMLIGTLIFTFFVFYYYIVTKRGNNLYIRPIAGLEEIDNAIGRATEMGRPMLFVPGLSSIDDVATLAGLSILSYITKKAAEYDSRMIVPVCDYIVLPIAQQIVKEAHSAAGRPDSYNPNDIFFVADSQFAYVAGVNGVMIREKTATNFYMGYFFAEALIMTETGSICGAIQIAGCDALTQIPFFITTCDYTLIGEELYAASAYLTRDPMILGTLKSQDYTKLIILLFIIIGSLLSTFNLTGLVKLFPSE